jgi:hypothetical protein
MEDQFGNSITQNPNEVPVPDLDWSVLDQDNIPTENNVESVPELQEAWTHTKDSNTNLIDNKVNRIITKKASDEEISGVVKQAKKEMMLGYTGKDLAQRLSAMFIPSLISDSKEELEKLASEQGLLGNVYIDISPFKSCKEAAQTLGRNRIRTAQYVVGDPTYKVCSSHKNGYCKELGKKVLASIDYNKEILSSYTNHFHLAGLLTSDQSINSKEELQDAFLRKYEASEVETPVKKYEPINIESVEEEFVQQITKSREEAAHLANERRFLEARPILAYLQDQMLKGKNGDALKESLSHKFSYSDISKYAEEISKVASLQGIIGNIYVDVSYYKGPQEAISSIKRASTNPIYLIQSYKENAFDNTLVKVAKATGCSEFPRNGKIDSKIAVSYIDDLCYSNRLSKKDASDLKDKVASDVNVLGIIRDAFVRSQEYKPEKRQAGIKATVLQSTAKKATDTEKLRRNVYKAIEAGVSINDIETKLASFISTTEAVGMIHDAVSNIEEIDANCLPNCVSEKYPLKDGATIKQASKCEGCIFKTSSSCVKQSVKFAGSPDLSKPYFDLDEHTEKVQLDDNPDVERDDMSDGNIEDSSFGSGMNIALDNLRKEGSMEIDLDSSEGMSIDI